MSLSAMTPVDKQSEERCFDEVVAVPSRHRVIFMPTTQVARIIAEHSPALNGKPGVKRALHESLLLYPMIHALASNPLTLSSKMLQDFVPEHLVRSFSQTMRVKWSHKLRWLGGAFGIEWSQVGNNTSTGAKAETTLSGEAMRLASYLVHLLSQVGIDLMSSTS